MATLIIDEQDIINGICLYMSHEKDVSPEEVEVELFYDDEAKDAFGAEVTINGKMEEMSMTKLISSVRLWLNLYSEMDGISAGIQLHFNEDETFYASAW